MKRTLTILFVFSTIVAVSMVLAFPVSNHANMEFGISRANTSQDASSAVSSNQKPDFFPSPSVAPILLLSTGIVGLVGINRKKE